MPQTPESDDGKPAETDEEIFLEADERLRISMEADGENRTQGIEDLEFEDGQQWPDDIYNQRKISRRPTLTINMTRRCVREVCNNMRQQRPRIKVEPVGEGATVEIAKVVSGLVRHIETQSKASVAYDVAGECAVKIGWGYARILADYTSPDSNEQELYIHSIRNPFTVYDDPSAVMPTGADRDWLIITQEMKRSKYKRLYPKAENCEYTKGGSGDVTRLWESKEKIRLAEYYRIHKQPEQLYTLQDGRTMYADEYRKQKLTVPLAVDPDTGNPMVRKSYRRTVQWFRLNGAKVVERRTLKGHHIPVSRCEGNVLDINGEVRRRGMVRDLKDTNRMLNYWATCETELVALAPRAPFIAAEGQLSGHAEWKDANQKPYSTLIYKPVWSNPDNPDSPVLPPPQRVEAMQIPAGVVNARQGAMQDLMALAGMPHDPRADLPGAVVSGKALRERQANSDRSHFQYYDNQTQFISYIGEILLDLIPYYYSQPKMQRILGEDGVPSMTAINQAKPTGEMTEDGQAIFEVKNNLSVGRFDVVMDTGPGYETKRQEGQEAVLDLLKTPLGEAVTKTGADIIVRNMDFAGASDLADRLLPTNPQGMDKAIKELPKEAQGIVQALQQQLQQAQKLIQHQALELKYKGTIEHDWMQTEIKKTLLQVTGKAHDTEMDGKMRHIENQEDNATSRFNTHVNATVKLHDTEVNAATQLLNTNLEAEHNKRAAEALIDNAVKTEKGNGHG